MSTYRPRTEATEEVSAVESGSQLLASRLRENNCCCLSPQAAVFCYGSACKGVQPVTESKHLQSMGARGWAEGLTHLAGSSLCPVKNIKVGCPLYG